MKIIHFTTTSRGGAGIFLGHLIKFLHKKNYENDVVTFSQLLFNGYLNISLNTFCILLKAVFLRYIIKTKKKRFIPSLKSIWDIKKLKKICY